ncbi:chemotaxis protein CheC [Neobacillus terrae]|uniref:chemotaxis protein CheC n=1 Tax=Neobacillus terrae TaxID=3034837 RepID=UPI00140E0BB1|nr:chemotaxis protein CheC [Neobacillus terrae]NHM29817.1 chemotaxis protein CheC [Neobacillus terrae]
MAFFQFSSLHLDILKEIGNIGAGNAATSLSKLLNKRIDMKVPDVKIVSFDEIVELAGGADSVAAGVFLRIEGEAPGNMFFILPLPQAENFIRQMIGEEEFSFSNPIPNEMAFSALQELGNILAGSYLSALSDFTDLALYPSVPALSIDMAGAIIGSGLMEHSQAGDYAIVIDTSFNEDMGDTLKEVRGHFFLLPFPDSFKTIFKTLGVNEDE